MDNELRDRTLWCGNLHYRVTEELLRELFIQAGPVEDVKIPKDAAGRARNFAFITFHHPESIGYTLALMDGITLYGRTIKMERRPQAAVDNTYVDLMANYCAYYKGLTFGPAQRPPNMYNRGDAPRQSFASQGQGLQGTHLPQGMPIHYHHQQQQCHQRGGVPPGPEYSRNYSRDYDRYPPDRENDRRDNDHYDRRARAPEPYARYDREFRVENGHPDMRSTHRGSGRYDRRYSEEQQRSRSDHRRDHHGRRH